MNREGRARIRTANSRTAVQAPLSAKSGKLPEWASLTAVVTGITIFAFATSSFYVTGLAFLLQEPLAIYFSPTDYLRITPSWAIPTLGLAGLVIVACGISTDSLRSLLDLLLSKKRFRPLLYGSGLLLVLVLWYLVQIANLPFKFRAILLCGLFSLTMLAGLSGGVAYFPGSTVVRLLIVTVTYSMFFALVLGFLYVPIGVQEAPLSRILFESEKDRVAAVEGRVIFDLDRYLLLLTENKSYKSRVPGSDYKPWVPGLGGSIVAIPHEKIKSIQTPPLAEPEQKPAPSVASPTPAGTPSARTETPYVLPSPVVSPTAPAAPQKK